MTWMTRAMLSWLWLNMAAGMPAAAAQGADRLAAARDLYVSARYEDSLGVLDQLRRDPQVDLKLVEKYRSLCLLALGRHDDAERAIAAVVTADPLYQPDESEASPRVRDTFAEVRRKLLPEIARAAYVAAKTAFDRQAWADSEIGFRLVLSLIDDPDAAGRLGDLRLLAAGFHELSARFLAADLAPLEPESAPIGPPGVLQQPETNGPDGPTPDEADADRIFDLGDPGVVPPVVIRQDLPAVPAALRTFARPRGLLEVVVDELGRVVAMSVRESIHPTYDLQILAAAAGWRYEPATRQGHPVRFRRLIQINLAR
jgi:hypothetical protein